MHSSRCVFVTGGTGYLGRPLIEQLVARGHEVRALVRPESQHKLPAGCTPIVGDALQEASYSDRIRPADIFVQLVGVSHPNPSKAAQFRNIDLVAARGAIKAAGSGGIQHFIYLSVAQPAPVMKAYIEVRAECERQIQESGMNAIILRPWYVLGPGHRWPYLLIPVYKLMESISATRKGALRLGLVTQKQMVDCLVQSVEAPATGVKIVEVPEIRAGRAFSPQAQRAAQA